ncbi:MAG: uracil phosphoribosyltransferase [candidate division KSB1 bacterium]|nr:uracil phosphoribosyltransferase [candidate division KSB1 bacterium]
MGAVVVTEHPLIRHKLGLVRMKQTEPWLFRQLVNEITYLMLYEATRNLRTRPIPIETPLASTTAEWLDDDVVVVPILRAGLGMLDGFLRLIPLAKVGFVGIYRDHESLEPVEYYCKVPELRKSQVYVLDPMLATGGSAVAAASSLKARGATSIRHLCLLAAPEGINALHAAHPDVEIYCAHIDERLDEQGYIVPGIGDCGDRLFWTR